MLTLYLVVGWIMVAAFLVLLVITILSMLGVISLEEQFRTKLFYGLILEVIAAVIFMFKQGPQLALDANRLKNAYVFNEAGVPVPFSVGEGLRFAQLEPTGFKDIRRIAELNPTQDTLFIKARDGETFLGYAPVTDELARNELSPEYRLYVGLHLCADGKDLRKGKQLIFSALDAADIDQEEKRKGVIQLFRIMSTEFKSLDEFKKLAGWTREYTTGHIKHKETAEIYSLAADRMQAGDVAANQSLSAVRDRLRLVSLNAYLFYLKIQPPDENSDVITRLRGDSIAAANALFGRIRRSYRDIFAKKQDILAAVARNDVPAIEGYMGFIDAYLQDMAATPR